MSTPSASVPFTVVKGSPDDTETAAVADALAVLAAEAASTATGADDPREIHRQTARTSARGLWGAPGGQPGVPVNFNPTGFRV